MKAARRLSTKRNISFKSRATIAAETAADIAANKKRSYDESWYDEYGLSAPEKTQHTMNKNTMDPASLAIEKRGQKRRCFTESSLI